MTSKSPAPHSDLPIFILTSTRLETLNLLDLETVKYSAPLNSQGLASEPVNFSRHGSAERSVYLMIITVLCSAGEKKRVVGEILRDFQYIPFLVNLQKFCFGTKCLTCCLKNSTQGDSTKIEESCLTFSIYFL